MNIYDPSFGEFWLTSALGRAEASLTIILYSSWLLKALSAAAPFEKKWLKVS